MGRETTIEITTRLTYLLLDKTVADDMMECIFIDEKLDISIGISLKFVPKCSVDNKAALDQVMGWCRTGNRPLSEPIPTQGKDAYKRC